MKPLGVKKGDRYRKFGGRRIYRVVAVRSDEVGVRAHEFDEVEWWEKGRFNFKEWTKKHGRYRENLSGHTVPQTIFVKA